MKSDHIKLNPSAANTLIIFSMEAFYPHIRSWFPSHPLIIAGYRQHFICPVSQSSQGVSKSFKCWFHLFWGFKQAVPQYFINSLWCISALGAQLERRYNQLTKSRVDCIYGGALFIRLSWRAMWMEKSLEIASRESLELEQFCILSERSIHARLLKEVPFPRKVLM